MLLWIPGGQETSGLRIQEELVCQEQGDKSLREQQAQTDLSGQCQLSPTVHRSDAIQSASAAHLLPLRV